MTAIALSISRRNASAARRFRSRNQSSASSNSRLASGKYSTRPACTEPRNEPIPDFTPWNRFHLTGVQGSDSSSDLLPPRGLDVRVLHRLEAVQESPGDFCALRLWEGERLLQDCLPLPFYVGILLSEEGTGWAVATAGHRLLNTHLISQVAENAHLRTPWHLVSCGVSRS